jgi:hypothetical protein
MWDRYDPRSDDRDRGESWDPAPHDELGGRTRIHRPHAVPAWHRDADPQTSGRQPAARRISEDEEAKVLAVAPAFLRSMTIAALDTGMRQGEMLELRFKDIDFGVRVTPRREECSAGASPGPPGSRVHHHDRALRQPEAREPPGRSGAPRTRRDVRSGPARGGLTVNLSSFRQEFGRSGEEPAAESRA